MPGRLSRRDEAGAYKRYRVRTFGDGVAERTLYVGGTNYRNLPVPITARLSKRFYDQFGDEAVNELVNLLNAMDTTYRDDLKELNNLNFARFDAKLEQRLVEQDARMDKRFAEQDARIEKRFAEQDARIDKRFAEQGARIEKRFAEQDARIDKRFAEQDARIDKRFAEQDARMERLAEQFARLEEVMEARFRERDARIHTDFARLEATVAKALTDHTRWMLGMWVTVGLAVIGLYTRG